MLKYQCFRGLQDEGRRPAFGEAERREIVENSGFMKSRCRFCSVATATPGSGTSDGVDGSSVQNPTLSGEGPVDSFV